MEKTFKSLHVHLWSRYGTVGLTPPKGTWLSFNDTAAASKTAESNLSGETLNKVYQLRHGEHSSFFTALFQINLLLSVNK